MGILLYMVALSGKTISPLLLLFFPNPKVGGKDTAYLLCAGKQKGRRAPSFAYVSNSLDTSSVELTLSFPLANQPLFLSHSAHQIYEIHTGVSSTKRLKWVLI